VWAELVGAVVRSQEDVNGFVILLLLIVMLAVATYWPTSD
jgi:hypothetical protein